MLRHKAEYAITGTAEDILNFLERDNHYVPGETIFSKEENGEDFYINYHCRKESNSVSINTKIYSTQAGKISPKCYLDDPTGEGNEVIRFEVNRVSDSRSLIAGYYVSENLNIALIFWLSMTRLAKAFDAKWDKEVQRYYQDTKDEISKISGVVWGWTDWKTDKSTGLTMRSYGLIPISSKKKTTKNTSKINQGTKNKPLKIEIKNIKDSNIIIGNENSANNKRIRKPKQKNSR